MIDTRRFHSGDEGYFEELVREHAPLVLAVTRSFARDLDHAEDLFQEVWHHTYRKRSSFSGRGSFAAWLHRVATNVCRSEYRARKVRSDAVEGFQRVSHPATLGWSPMDPLQRMQRQELHERLHRAMAHLSEREHEALVLRVLEGLSAEEAAGVMGVRKATVRSLVRHAIKRLRTVMEEADDGLSRHESTH
jgi:RNA polymerase sigma-70 factor (ECF subfamily)